MSWYINLIEKGKAHIFCLPFFCGGAPGMGDNLAVKVRYELGSRNH
jgi:hypothetical protein